MLQASVAIVAARGAAVPQNESQMNAGSKFLLLTSLYVAQGLPYGFFTQALPVLMREQGLSLKAISATSLLFLPWALKFLLAPMVDRYGTRRGWIMPLQCFTVVGAAMLSFADLAESLRLIFLALFLFNLCAAMQDVATDGLAVNLLVARERGAGNAIQVGAYRVGMVLGGGFLLWVFARAGWSPMFVGMTALLALASLPVVFLREPPKPAGLEPLRAPAALTEWRRRLRLPGMSAFIGLICFYKFGDSMAASFVGPYMKDAGLSTAAIALIKGTFGSGATLAGAALGGWLVLRHGRRAALLWSGLATGASLTLYALATWTAGGVELIAAACIAEHVFGGAAVVALFTLMMDASDPAHASTDYTLLACAVVITQGAASFAGAALADAAGYGVLFATGVFLSVAGCLTLIARVDRGAGVGRLRGVWS